MKVYRNAILSGDTDEGKDKGDELLSDSYKFEMIGGVLMKVQGKLTSSSNEISDTLIGGNKSAEGTEEETLDPSVQTEIDFISANRLQNTGIEFKNKKEFKTYLSSLVKKIAAMRSPNCDDMEEWKKNMTTAGKHLTEIATDLVVFTGEHANANGNPVFVHYDETGNACGYLFLDGCTIEKQ